MNAKDKELAPQEQLGPLIQHLATNAPGFARRLTQSGLEPSSLDSPSSLAALPVIRKDDLSDIQSADPPFGGFLACEPGQLKRVFQSPGPIYDPESREPDYWRWEEALRAGGFQPDDLVLNAFAYHLTPAGAMFEEGLWAIGCAVIPAGVGNQDQQVQALSDLGVNGYVGLPSYLKALLEKADELNLELKLEKAFVTAEPLPPSLRGFLQDRGVRVNQGYGTAECGNLGYECERQDGLHIPQDVLLQICDINSGEPLPDGECGEIVVTLFKRDYALVRFGTGDLSTVIPDPCACGRPSLRLAGWQGRVGDAVKVRGMFLHPRQLQQLMIGFPEVERWQALITRQEHKDFLSLRIVAPSADAQALAERVASEAREQIKFNPEVVSVNAADLASDAPPIEDTRSWE